jgi:hypothetical protein
MRLLCLTVLILLTAACARPERAANHADWLKEATRVWSGETKARVIAAAEAVVKHSDPGDITVEYSKSGFSARRKFFIFAVLATAEGEDRWTFSASENSEGASASVRIVQRGTARSGNFSERFRDNQALVGSLRLFYARVDYMLGKRAEWVTCSGAVAQLSLPAEAPGLQSMCSITHQGADAPPPQKLAPKAKVSGESKKGPPDPPQIAGGDDPD